MSVFSNGHFSKKKVLPFCVRFLCAEARSVISIHPPLNLVVYYLSRMNKIFVLSFAIPNRALNNSKTVYYFVNIIFHFFCKYFCCFIYLFFFVILIFVQVTLPCDSKHRFDLNRIRSRYFHGPRVGLIHSLLLFTLFLWMRPLVAIVLEANRLCAV